jgi:signal peptidase I
MQLGLWGTPPRFLMPSTPAAKGLARILVATLVLVGLAALLPPSPGAAAMPRWKSFGVVSGSMMPTLRMNEYVVADMTYYAGHAPARGDVVVHSLPADDNVLYIKRIVALAGDRIQFLDGRIILNGNAVDEPYADIGDPKAYYNTTPAWTVPPDHVFLAGDNRANSTDSRATRHGPVPVKNLLGRTTVILITTDLKRIGSWVGSPTK